MSADLSSVELCARVFAEAKPWEKDPMVYNLPWKQEPLPEKLCFGKSLVLDLRGRVLSGVVRF
jgi:hypothetical protein